jgi:hypothetical protein
MRRNVVDLTRDIMTIEAVGGYDDAVRLIGTRAVVRPPVQVVLDRLQGIPVDIAPRFVTAEALLAEKGTR